MMESTNVFEVEERITDDDIAYALIVNKWEELAADMANDTTGTWREAEAFARRYLGHPENIVEEGSAYDMYFRFFAAGMSSMLAFIVNSEQQQGKEANP